MLQFSVYSRVCNGNDAVKKHEGRLKAALPPNGSIRLLVITEKQYQSIQICWESICRKMPRLPANS